MPWDWPSFATGVGGGLAPWFAEKMWNVLTSKKLVIDASGFYYRDLSGVLVLLNISNPSPQANTLTGHTLISIPGVGNQVVDEFPASFDLGNAKALASAPIRIEPGETLLGAVYFPDSTGRIAEVLNARGPVRGELRLRATHSWSGGGARLHNVD